MRTESSCGISYISFTAKLALTLAAVLAAAGFALGQVLEPPPASLKLPPPAHRGTVERVKIHGQSLEGNLEGDSPDRDVSIYLPPSYKTHSNQHYPVLYFLHGYFDRDDNWFGVRHVFVDAPLAIDRAIAGGAREMIVVMPDAYTAYKGSMYSNSVTTGDWESFITQDLVSFVDAHYRTIPVRASRGLAGHSMGGYGTMRIGMKYPDTFSSLYAMSACCLTPNPDRQWPGMEKAEKVRSAADIGNDFGTGAIIAMAAAWSPDPKKPPLYLDLPVADGKLQAAVAARWDANSPLAMLDQYVTSLKKIHAIALDAGTKDPLLPSIQQLDARMTLFGIDHTFETYDGTHISGVQTRLEENVIPFFSKHLSFASTKP
jgi:S-formylglutathione hydrolase